MAFNRATAIIILTEADNGHTAFAINWPKSPPQGLAEILKVATMDQPEEDMVPTFQDRYVSDNKTELNTQLASFVTNVYAVPPQE